MTSAVAQQQKASTRMVGITIPLGPFGLTVGIYRHRVLAIAIGVRRWLR